MKYRSFCRQGRSRESCEDALLCLPEKGFFLVCDGVGEGAGAAASVIEVFSSLFRDATETSLGVDLLEEAFQRANSRLLAESLDKGSVRCAAVIALLLQRGSFNLAWVGDCRAYRMNAKASLQCLSRDHTRLQELLDRGVVDLGDVHGELQKSALTRCLGAKRDFSPEYLLREELGPEDRFLLCSDGVSDLLEEGDLKKVLSMEDGDSQIEVLEEKVEEGDDDAAAVVISLQAQDLPPGELESAELQEGIREALALSDESYGRKEGGDRALSKAGASPSIFEFIKRLPHRSRREKLSESLIFFSIMAFSLLTPQIFSALGKQLSSIGLSYWFLLALLIYFLLLRIRLR